LSRSLGQWLTYQTQVHPQAIDLGLERLRKVLTRLHWKQPSVPVVTVAGTNGKGSVTAYCTSILTSAGYRVGTFTSPHLRDYRERIRIHDRLVTEQELLWAFELIEGACIGTEPLSADTSKESGLGLAGEAISLTYFEYNALAAFLVFEAARVDAWVLEVGMGGRLDAVNIVDASVAVVVSIGLDHQAFLGNTLPEIAREKAGIFRGGRAAVLGSRDPVPVLAEIAKAVGAPVKRLGVEFDYRRVDGGGWDFKGSRWTLAGLPQPALAGDTQFSNAATALAALEELEPTLTIPAAAVARGLEVVRLVGRFQVIAAVAGGPQWILDVAHNPDSARVLGENLRASAVAGRTLAVCGILADKDAPAITAAIRDCFDAWWLVSTDGARGSSAAELAARIEHEVKVPLHTAHDVAGACAAAAAAAGEGDRIVVFGSFHVVGPAFDWLEAKGFLPPSALPE
jgi:dihydrofolate synthase/folylpolyglutamate synthase